MTITVIGKTKDSAKRDWAKIKHKYHMSLNDTIQFLSNNVNTIHGKSFFNHTLVLTEGYEDNPVYEEIGRTAKTQIALVIDESRANVVHSVAAADEPTNEEIYQKGYEDLIQAIRDYIKNPNHQLISLETDIERVDEKIVESFNFGDKHTGYNFTKKLEYDGMRVTPREKLNTLNEIAWQWITEDRHHGVIDVPIANKRKRQLMLINEKHERPEEPKQEEVKKDNESFLSITLEDINAVPKVLLEGKKINRKQVVKFEYATNDDTEILRNYLYVQTLESGGKTEVPNVVKKEWNTPVDQQIAESNHRYKREVLDTNTGKVRTEGSNRPEPMPFETYSGPVLG